MSIISKRKCLDHRSGVRHQINGVPAAYYIAFFSLIRFKYGTLTHKMRSPDSVPIVVSTLGCRAKGWGIETRWTRLANKVLERNFAA